MIAFHVVFLIVIRKKWIFLRVQIIIDCKKYIDS